ncbi:Or33a.2 family protein [Megaselia abdita]
MEKNGEINFSSFDAFKPHFQFWTFLGAHPIPMKEMWKKYLLKIYIVILHFLICVYYPISLTLGFFQLRETKDLLLNMSMMFSINICALKVACLFINMDGFYKIREFSKLFDNKSRYNSEESSLLIEFQRKCNFYFKTYFALYFSIIVAGGFSVINYDRRRLQYPAYFPFDWSANATIYGVVVGYQFFGWCIHVLGNLTYDTYPPFLIYILTQYLRTLCLRISRIGYDERTKEENHELLKSAIKDHQIILECFHTVNKTISPTLFAQFIATGVNIVSSLILTIYFSEDVFERAYFILAIAAVIFEIILACFYGSIFSEVVDHVPRALYSCSWYTQSKEFKVDLMIFLENTLRNREFVAGGLIPISLASFMKIMKSTYSTFTLLMRMTE